MTPEQETKLRRAMIRHRITVDKWTGATWTNRRHPPGIVGVVCRLLTAMDGGSMWSSDLLNLDTEAPKAIGRMRLLGLVTFVRRDNRMGDLLAATDEADKFVTRYTIGDVELL